jgi:hypothetical protein
MYNEPFGLVLIVIGIMAIWWALLPSLTQHLPFSQGKALWSGWGVILAIGLIVWWWTPSSTDAQQPKPPINQGGTITGGSGNTITNTYNANTYITVTSTTNPQVTRGETTLLNGKTEEGYQTHVQLKVVSPFTARKLSVVTHAKSLTRVDLSSSTDMLMLSHWPVENGQARVSAQNVTGDLTLVIVTTEPIGKANPVTIDPRIE